MYVCRWFYKFNENFVKFFYFHLILNISATTKFNENWGSINMALLKPQIGVQYKYDDKPNNGVQ